MRTASIGLGEWERPCPDGTGAVHRPEFLRLLAASLVPYYAIEPPRPGGGAAARVATPRSH